jgi:hypothetical protein
MDTVYTALQISALILAIILPVASRKKKNSASEMSNLAVNEKGFLEEIVKDPFDQHTIH